MINALTASIWPVLNAHFIVMVVMSIYSVLGATLLTEKDPEGFKSFTHSMLTMFQVATFDDWGDIARKHENHAGDMDFGTSVFFISYLLLMSFTLLPVVIAVLLDNFMQSTRKEKDTLLLQKQAAIDVTEGVGALDPLLRRLLSASTEEELSKMISSIFSRLDSDCSGTINCHELQEGMKKLKINEHKSVEVRENRSLKIDLSREAFDAITENGKLCLDDGEVDCEHFEIIMRKELIKFCDRQLAMSIPAVLKNDQHMGILMFAVKLVLDSLGKCCSDRDEKDTERQRETERDNETKLLESSDRECAVPAHSSATAIAISRFACRAPAVRQLRTHACCCSCVCPSLFFETFFLTDGSPRAYRAPSICSVGEIYPKDYGMESEIIRVLSSEEDPPWTARRSFLRNPQTKRFASFTGVSTETLLVQPLEVETRILGRRFPSRSSPATAPGVPTDSSGLLPRSGAFPHTLTHTHTSSLSCGLGRSKSFERMIANDRATAAPFSGGEGVRQDLQRRLCRLEMRTVEMDNKVDHLTNDLEKFQEKILAKLDMLVPKQSPSHVSDS